MVQCAVEGCGSRSDIDASCVENGIHFHRIPKESQLRKKWMKAINKLEVNNHTRVCTKHFKKENYYTTKQGLYKLISSTIPEINLNFKGERSDSSDDEEMPYVEPQLQNTSMSHRSQSQYTRSDETIPKIETKLIALRPTKRKQEGEVSNGTTVSMVGPQEPQGNITPPRQLEQNNSKEITTDNVLRSSTIKPGVQKHKVKTLLEKKLLKEVRRLQEMGKKGMEAIESLLEQNRRLLERNSFLEKALEDHKKLPKNKKIVAQKES